MQLVVEMNLVITVPVRVLVNFYATVILVAPPAATTLNP